MAFQRKKCFLSWCRREINRQPLHCLEQVDIAQKSLIVYRTHPVLVRAVLQKNSERVLAQQARGTNPTIT